MLMNTILENRFYSTSHDLGWNVDRLDRKDIASAADVLRDAFATHPIAQYMFESLDDGPERFRVMFEHLIRARNWSGPCGSDKTRVSEPFRVGRRMLEY